MHRVQTRTPVPQVRLPQLVRELAGDARVWSSLVEYCAGQRWYRLLSRDADHEVWLLSWLPGQSTGFHDHGGSAGAFAVARGTLAERPASGGRPWDGRITLPRGAVRSFGPRYVHDVTNPFTEPAVSVHAYSPPLATMRRFEVSSTGELVLTAVTEERS
jgi:predicted metal-dependent enzyme (double-stranded beta helix superfamily)